ncbi:hypothetical protein A0H81_03755, partial [Grifola frondosa]
MNALPAQFPPLPAAPDQFIWSPNVQSAYKTIYDAYDRIIQLLHLDDSDPLRLRYHSDKLAAEIVPILTAMEEGSFNGPTLPPVTREYTGRRGCPRKKIDQAFLKEIISPTWNISISRLAKVIGTHRHTVRRNLRSYGLKHTYLNISNDELDLIIKAYKQRKPDSGIRYLTGFLRRHGFRIQKTRVY